MAQDYDKIFKENIEEIILPLAEKILNIRPEKLIEIPDDLQRTIERKPDFLKKVGHQDRSKDYILQLEFQKEDDLQMVYRMLEYYGMLARAYKIEIHQYVFYLGMGSAQMRAELKQKNLAFKFDLINLQDFDYQTFIASNTPEEIILAILGNFGTDKPQVVVQKVLAKLKVATQDNLRREKCVKQLEILSNLRNLQAEIIKQLELMALTYDLEKDIRFKQGIEKGVEKRNIEAIQTMRQNNLSVEQIAQYLNLPLDFVKEVIKKKTKN
jgi:predicted transposase YdaD